jgi:hypothetical protein
MSELEFLLCILIAGLVVNVGLWLDNKSGAKKGNR